MVKIGLKERAVALRRQGYSYNLIGQKIPVSKSTLSLWLAHIPYIPNNTVINRVRGAALHVSEWRRQNKKQSLEKAHDAAVRELGNLSSNDLFMLGLGVYIGEGSKTGDLVRVINSDPQVICLVIRWFEESFGLDKGHFSLAIHLYPDNNVGEALTFWSNMTYIPLSQFGKTQIDRRKKNAKKRGMLKYGTAHLNVCSRGKPEFGVFLARKINFLIRETYRQINQGASVV